MPFQEVAEGDENRTLRQPPATADQELLCRLDQEMQALGGKLQALREVAADSRILQLAGC